jgi:hypothetical protein
LICEPSDVVAVNGCVVFADTVTESGETVTMTVVDVFPPQLILLMASVTRNRTCRSHTRVLDSINHPFPISGDSRRTVLGCARLVSHG